MRPTALVLTFLAGFWASPDSAALQPDEAGVRAVDAAYVKAWLDNDEGAVLATLAPDAVMMPAGQYPLITADEIKGFWWPKDGSTTKILSFQRTIDELAVSGDLAFARGTDSVTFTYDKGGVRSQQTSHSMTLAVYRKQRDGSWRISRMMWANRSK